MNPRILPFLLPFAGIFILFASRFSPPIMKDKPLPGSWEQEWTTVDSLEKKGLTKSALEKVNTLYDRAIQEKNGPMHVRTIFYVLKYTSYTEENPMRLNLARLEKEIKVADPVVRSIFHSYRAELYWNYFQNNRWSLMNRTETVNFDAGDIETWDLKKIMEATVADVNASVKDAKALKFTPVDRYKEVVVSASGAAALRPTLYDLLGHRALDILLNDQNGLTQPADRFDIDNDWVFYPSAAFSSTPFSTTDTLNFRFHTVKLLQGMEAFHLQDADPTALIDVTLRRLSYMHTKAVVDTRDSLYLHALQEMDKKFASSPASTQILYAIAQAYQAEAAKYAPYGEEQYKGSRKKAWKSCTEGEARFPDSYGAQLCQELRLQLEAKSINIQGERVEPIQKPFRTLLSYTNIQKVHQRIIPMSDAAWERMAEWNYERIITFLVKQEPIWTGEVNLPADDDLNSHSAEIQWPALKAGAYVTLVSANPDFGLSGNGIAYNRVWVSDLSFTTRQGNTGKLEVFVLNRNSGKPIRGATVSALEQKYDYNISAYKWNTLASYTTNEDGTCVIEAKPNASRSVGLVVTYGTDRLSSEQTWYQYNYKQDVKTRISTHFFLDRAIYRPGQTIYFKGMVLETTPEGVSSIKTNFSTKVTFYNVNHEVVSSVDLTTNEFGTFQGTFTAPQGVLNGQMRISDNYGTQYFSVEDYKRPKFEVTVDPVKESFRLGDEVTVQGKAMAYAGSNVDGATVKYRVVRNASFPWWGCWYWWRPYPSAPQMEIAHGETVTKADGTFEVKFRAIPDKSISRDLKPQFSYNVIVDVVDITGETRSSSGYVNVGYVSLSADFSLPGFLDAGKEHDLRLHTRNLNGEFEPARGTLAIYALESPGRIMRQRFWARPDKFVISREDYTSKFPTDVYDNEDDDRNWKRGAEVWKTNFNTKEEDSLRLKGLGSWPQGRYVAELITQDKYGEEVKVLKWFTVGSTEAGKMPLKEPFRFTALKSMGEPGEKAAFMVGSSYSDAMVLFETWHKKVRVGREWIRLDEAQAKREMLIEEKHRGNFGYSLMMVKDGRVYSLSQMVIVPWTNKQLDIEIETFRDKLLPGAKEEWKIIIKGPGGDAVAAELLAGMYDASLDYFRANYWGLSVNPSDYFDWYWVDADCFTSRDGSIWNDDWNPYISVSRQQYDALNFFGYYMYLAVSRNGGRYSYRGFADELDGDFEGGDDFAEEDEAMPVTAASPKADEDLKGGGGKNMQAKDIAGELTTLANGETTTRDPEGQDADKRNTAGGENLGDVKVRTNLNETAFFFPQLHTNEKGEVVLSFTMPEALTRWKLMLMGHTKDLKLGQLEKTVVTQKDLMVMPNVPRFLREGDKFWFTAKVSNLTREDMSGSAQLELLDALTLKPIDVLMKNSNAVVPFSAKAGQSAPLTWEITVPEGLQAVTWRVKARAGNFTDGEESSLPVLTNRMLVTESMPLPVRPLQTRTFIFDRMKNNNSTTLRNHRYTLEFTSNPAWYAVQALPYMMEYPYECSEQTFSRFYANSIASHVANSHPRVKSVFDAWKNTDKEALLSNLEKNQELKYILLEETPWVMNSNDESERKQRVGLLFDLNRMSNEQEVALRKLQQAQVSNGAWPWFPGMPESEYITRHIVCGMGHLDKLGIRSVRDDKRTWAMITNAIRYLDVQMFKEYKWIQEHATNPDDDHLSYDRVHYMYARSFFMDVPFIGLHKQGFDYFVGQEVKYWNNRLGNRYLQGMMALNLNRVEKQATAMDIIRSLKENSLQSDEMGMYWKKDVMGGWSWYEAPIEEQSLLIEAFGEVANDQVSVEEMKLWLLKQKQTQDWKTTRATAEACYALLLNGTDFLAESGMAEIKLGSMEIKPSQMEDVRVEAGTGYFKTSWGGSDIRKDMADVEVKNPNKVAAWGAVYWQYFEQLDKITSFRETGVKIVKQLFLTQNSATGPVITPITSQTVLKPGDLIKVRIEIRCDRDMDYVHMKDMRASGFEPVNVISRYKWQDGLGYYESTRDAATNFFFDRLPKGTWVFEYPLRVNHRGDFSNGITTLQCMYAPEFTTHSEGIRVLVK